jgi:hypothetical protein
MSIAFERKLPAFAAAVFLLSSLLLGGCASSAVSSLMDARAEVPPSPKTSALYPAVHDMPPKREISAMTPDERSKLTQELIATRDHQAEAAKAKAGPLEPIKP